MQSYFLAENVLHSHFSGTSDYHFCNIFCKAGCLRAILSQIDLLHVLLIEIPCSYSKSVLFRPFLTRVFLLCISHLRNAFLGLFYYPDETQLFILDSRENM